MPRLLASVGSLPPMGTRIAPRFCAFHLRRSAKRFAKRFLAPTAFSRVGDLKVKSGAGELTFSLINTCGRCKKSLPQLAILPIYPFAPCFMSVALRELGNVPPSGAFSPRRRAVRLRATCGVAPRGDKVGLCRASSAQTIYLGRTSLLWAQSLTARFSDESIGSRC